MIKSTPHRRRILISPLNWGLGHASRLLPIIDTFIQEGHHCVVAGESPSIDVIKEAFPNLTYETTKGFRITLSKSHHQLLKLFTQLPSLITSIYRDKKNCKTLIKKHQIDLVVSDNRYGFHYKKIASILISHQTAPKLGRLLPWLKPLVRLTLKQWHSHFTACWIPDINELPNISGQLSKTKLNSNTFRIGLCSRLALINPSNDIHNSEKSTDVLIILSGPEPHRSLLERKLITYYKNTDYKVIILQGLPQNPQNSIYRDNITLVPHCSPALYHKLLLTSKTIICRSGYSTIMDLFFVNRKAILIPTPGQYEQEYLARHLKSEFHFPIVKQRELPQSQLLNSITHLNRITPHNNAKKLNLPPLPEVF